MRLRRETSVSSRRMMPGRGGSRDRDRSDRGAVVLVTRDHRIGEGEIQENVSAWSRRLCGSSGAEVVFAPRLAPRRDVLDLTRKTPALRGVVCGLRGPLRQAPRPRFDEELSVLVAGAACPVLTVQPGVEVPTSRPRVAVVGVNQSIEASRAADAAAELLRASAGGSVAPRLILAHGFDHHPADLARRTRLRTLTEGKRLDRLPWLVSLADALNRPGLDVEVVVKPTWAPDLISGLVQKTQADLAGLGVDAGTFDRDMPRLDTVHRRILRGIPCPLLTTTAPFPSAPSADHGSRPHGRGRDG